MTSCNNYSISFLHLLFPPLLFNQLCISYDRTSLIIVSFIRLFIYLYIYYYKFENLCVNIIITLLVFVNIIYIGYAIASVPQHPTQYTYSNRNTIVKNVIYDGNNVVSIQ